VTGSVVQAATTSAITTNQPPKKRNTFDFLENRLARESSIARARVFGLPSMLPPPAPQCALRLLVTIRIAAFSDQPVADAMPSKLHPMLVAFHRG